MTTRVQPVPASFTGAGGIRLAADVRGSGPPVLLLHGGGQTRHSWHLTAERIAAAGRSAIALDLRGHGDSDWSTGRDYGPRVNADDLSAILASLDEPAALVGASLGGIAALIATGDHAGGGVGAATCLVLVDVTPRMEPLGVSRIRRFMSASPDGFASLDEAADAIARYLPGRGRPPGTAGLAKNLRLGSDQRYRWHWDPQLLDDLEGDPEILHQVLRHAAAGVRIPTLVVRGASSDVVSPEGVRELQELIPHAEIAEVGAAGHMIAGDDNDTFSSAIVDFVSRH